MAKKKFYMDGNGNEIQEEYDGRVNGNKTKEQLIRTHKADTANSAIKNAVYKEDYDVLKTDFEKKRDDALSGLNDISINPAKYGKAGAKLASVYQSDLDFYESKIKEVDSKYKKASYRPKSEFEKATALARMNSAAGEWVNPTKRKTQEEKLMAVDSAVKSLQGPRKPTLEDYARAMYDIEKYAPETDAYFRYNTTPHKYGISQPLANRYTSAMDKYGKIAVESGASDMYRPTGRNILDPYEMINAYYYSRKGDKYIEGMIPTELTQMTEGETKLYMTLHNHSEKDANDFLAELRPVLEERATQKEQEEIREKVKRGGADAFEEQVKSVLRNVVYSPFAAMESATENIGDKLFDRESDGYNSAIQRQLYNAQAARDALTEGWHPIFGSIYKGGMSILDSTVGSLMGMGLADPTAGKMANGILKSAGSLNMASGAMAQQMQDAHMRGLSSGKQLAEGITAGVMAAITEKMGMERLFGKKTGGIVKNFIKGGASETLEEGAEWLVNTGADYAIAGEKSNIAQNGIKNSLKELGLEAIGAFVSGGAASGIGGGVSNTYHNNYLKKVGSLYADKSDLLIDLGVEAAENSSHKQIGKAVEEAIAKGLEKDGSMESIAKTIGLLEGRQKGSVLSDDDMRAASAVASYILHGESESNLAAAGNSGSAYLIIDAIADNDNAKNNIKEAFSPEKIGGEMRQNEAVQSLIETGLESSRMSRAYALAKEAERNGVESLSDKEIGNLYLANLEQVTKEGSVQWKTNNEYMRSAGKNLVKNPDAMQRVLSLSGAEARNILQKMQGGRQVTADDARFLIESVAADAVKSGNLVEIVKVIDALDGREADYIGSHEAIVTAKSIQAAIEGKATRLDYEVIRKSNGAVTVLSVAEEMRSENASTTKTTGLVMNDAAMELDKKTRTSIHDFAKRTGSTVIVEHFLVNKNGEVIMGEEKDGVIRINADYADVAHSIAVHEFTHLMKKIAPKAYAKFKNYVVSKMKSEGTYEGAMATLREDYEDLSDEGLIDELCAQTAERLFRDEAELTSLIKKDRTLAEWVKDAWFKVLDMFGRTDERTHAQLMWKKCVKEASRAKSKDVTTGEVKYKKEYSFNKQVDDALDNKIQRGYSVYVGRLPKLLEKCGLNPELPMLMHPSHIRDINHEKSPDNIHYHGISSDIIKQIPDLIKYPAMIYDSISEDNSDNSICILTTQCNDEGAPIVIVITNSEQDGKYLDVKMEVKKTGASNHVDTMYGKDGFSYHMDSVIDKDAVLYVSKNGMDKLLNRKNLRLNSDGKLRLLARLDNLRFDTIIHQSRNVVNTKSMQNDENNSTSSQKRPGVSEKLDEYMGDFAARLSDNAEEEILRETQNDSAEKADIEKLRAENAELRKQIEKERGKAKQDYKRVLEKAERIKFRWDKSEIKKRIDSDYNYLSRMIENPTDTRHVPEHLRASVAEVLKCFNFETVQLDRLRDKGKTINSPTAVRLEKLSSLYEKVMEKTNTINSPELNDEYIKSEIKELLNEIPVDETGKPKRIQDMEIREMAALQKILASIHNSITRYNKAFTNGLNKPISGYGEELIEECRDRMERKKGKLHHASDGSYEEYSNKIIDGLDRLLTTDNLRPYDFVYKIGGTVEMLYGKLRDGYDKYTLNWKFAIESIDKIKGEMDFSELIGKELPVNTFKLSNGDEVSLTTTQIMSLYALNKRRQAREHIYFGGIVPGKADTGKKEDGKFLKRKIESAKPYKVTETDIGEMLKILTEEQKKFVDEIVGFLSNTCADWGNETSMKLFGYEKYGETYYFPIKVADIALPKSMESMPRDTTLKHPPQSKKTKEHARQPLMVLDFFDVVTNHINSMALYNSMVLPMLDIDRVMNYAESETTKINGVEVEQIKDGARSMFRQAWGRASEEYIEGLFKSINGQKNVDSAGLGDVLLSNSKKTAVAASLNVLFQQFGSITRSMCYLSPRDLKVKVTKADTKEMLEKCPIAYWKNLGFYDTGMSIGMKQTVFGKEPIIDRLTLKPYGWADMKTWTRIYAAVKKEVARENPTLEVGGDAYFEKVTNRFREIIDATQVVDTPLHKTPTMRSKNWFMKVETVFKSEPLTTLNTFQTRVLKAVRENNTAKGISRAIEVYVFSSLVQSLLRSISGLMRLKPEDEYDDDGKKRSKFEVWLDLVIDGFIDELNPIEKIPFAGTIMSMFSGYSSSRIEWAPLERLIQAVKQIYNKEDGRNGLAELVNVTKNVFNLKGIPASNILREVRALTRTIGGPILGEEYMDYLITKWDYSVDNKKNRHKFMRFYEYAVKNNEYESAAKIFCDYYNVTESPEIIEAWMKETARLYKKTEDKTLFYNEPADEINFHDGKIELKNDRYKKFISEFNQSYINDLNNMLKSNYYKKLSDDEKVTALKKVKKHSLEKTQMNYIPIEALDNEKSENVIREMDILFSKSGEDLIPSLPAITYLSDGVKTEIIKDDYEEHAEQYYNLLWKTAYDFVTDKEYKKLTTEEKIKGFNEIASYSENISLQDFAEKFTVTEWQAQMEDGELKYIDRAIEMHDGNNLEALAEKMYEAGHKKEYTEEDYERYIEERLSKSSFEHDDIVEALQKKVRSTDEYDKYNSDLRRSIKVDTTGLTTDEKNMVESGRTGAAKYYADKEYVPFDDGVRYMKVYDEKLSNVIEMDDYLIHRAKAKKTAALSDGSPNLKNTELEAYLETTGYPKPVKSALFEALVQNPRSKNPYGVYSAEQVQAVGKVDGAAGGMTPQQSSDGNSFPSRGSQGQGAKRTTRERESPSLQRKRSNTISSVSTGVNYVAEAVAKAVPDKSQIMQIIDGMDVSDAMRKALYAAFGVY